MSDKRTAPAKPPDTPKRQSLSARRAERAEHKRAAFLDAYERIGTVVGAAHHVGLDPRTHYKWLDASAVYAAKFQRAEESAIERLEQEARRRALVGTEEPVFYRGQIVGHIKKHSDTLMIFLLKAKRPDVYRERVELTGKNGGPLQGQVELIHRAKASLIEKLGKLSGRAAAGADDGANP